MSEDSPCGTLRPPPAAALEWRHYLLVLGVGVLAFGYRVLSFTDFPNDHYVHLSGAQQMAMGAMPVRDFVEPGLPLMRAMSWGTQVLLGEGLWAELLLVSGALAIAAMASALTALRLRAGAAMVLVAATAQIIVHPSSYCYPKLLLYAVGLWLLGSVLVRRGLGYSVALGLWIGASFLFRHDHGVLLFVAVAAGAAAAAALRIGLSRSALLAIAGGALVCAGPYALWVETHGGLGRYVKDGIAFSARESERSQMSWPALEYDAGAPVVRRVSLTAARPPIKVRWAPGVEPAARQAVERKFGLELDGTSTGATTECYVLTDWSFSTLAALVRHPLVEDTDGIDRATMSLMPDRVPSMLQRVALRLPLWLPLPGAALRPARNAQVLLFYALWALPIASGFVALRSRAMSAEARALVLATCVLQVAANLVLLRDALNVRLQDVFAPATVLLAWAGSRAAASGGRWRLLARAGVAIGSIVFIAAAATVGEAEERVGRTGLLGGWPRMMDRWHTVRMTDAPVGRRLGRATDEERLLASYLAACTAPTQAIFVPAHAPEIFFQSKRRFAGGHVSLMPGYFADGDSQQLMLDRLQQQDVPFVIVTADSWPDERTTIPRVAAWVESRYTEVARVGRPGTKVRIVMAEARRRPSRLWHEWPCFGS